MVFFFIVRLKFPSDKSIANVILSRHNHEIVKQIRRFGKLDFQIQKNEADFDFLQSCQQNNLIPKFLISKSLVAVFIFQGRISNVKGSY